MEKIDLEQRNIVFFDGTCHLCNYFVDAVLMRDELHFFLFAPLQGETSKTLLPAAARDNIDTVIFYQAGKTSYKSTAILKIIIGLGGFYTFFKVFWLVPSPFRDSVYAFVAKNRYRWFGQKDQCRLPTNDEKNFLLP